ncbi:unnamed protein product, partial [Ectocarpus sp. 8 AP-2014]
KTTKTTRGQKAKSQFSFFVCTKRNRRDRKQPQYARTSKTTCSFLLCARKGGGRIRRYNKRRRRLRAGGRFVRCEIFKRATQHKESKHTAPLRSTRDPKSTRHAWTNKTTFFRLVCTKRRRLKPQGTRLDGGVLMAGASVSATASRAPFRTRRASLHGRNKIARAHRGAALGVKIKEHNKQYTKHTQRHFLDASSVN